MGEKKVTPDFSGYATKAGLKCTDGRTIMPDAFKHQDKTKVPLVWQHSHDDPENVLGHVTLENRADGVYAYGYFNDTPKAQHARTLVQHDDINALSIFANGLSEKAKQVVHGIIREVSLVLAGANPGAFIDNITLQHGEDGPLVELEDEAIIFTGLALEHEDQSDESDDNTDDGDRTVQEVYDSMDEDQKTAVHAMISAAIESGKSDNPTNGTAEHSDHTDDPDGKEVLRMSRNAFEDQGGAAKSGSSTAATTAALSHDALRGIVAEGVKRGSLKAAFEDYATEHLEHGITDIDILFPEAKNIDATPEFDKRRTEWVSVVWNGTRKLPFSRVRSVVADITQEDARAKGYIKGNLKKEEWFGLTKRTTTPTTIYKKQSLDRDDIIDITDFDVVVWLKAEMRLMFEEEVARAILIGDGREVDDEDKIKDPAAASDGAGIRSILNEHDLYAATINVNIGDAGSSYKEVINAVTRAMKFYKGSGQPTFFTTFEHATEMLLLEDGMERRLYRTKSELASELGVANIVEVEVMDAETDLIGIIVNLRDYGIGTDRGGETTFFDDFDIDYNKYKYLYEGRMSGGLTKIRSALIIKSAPAAATEVTPVSPAFVEETGVITPATTTGVTYKRADTNATVTTGAPITLAAGASLKIYAVPSNPANYFFDNNVEDEWTFKRPSA